MVPNQQVFNKLLRQSADSKPFKQKKVPLADFERDAFSTNSRTDSDHLDFIYVRAAIEIVPALPLPRLSAHHSEHDAPRLEQPHVGLLLNL